MPTPNRGFVNSIKGLDAQLDVRYGDFVRQWVIERRASVPDTEIGYLKRREARVRRILDSRIENMHPNAIAKLEDTWTGLWEQIVSAERGYRVILFAQALTQQIYDALVLADMTRYGGYAAWADRAEADEARREADIDRQLANKRNALNKEAYDMLHHIWAKKSAKLAQGERDMRYLLHGKRTQAGDAPLIQLTDF
jgi:hypothetical protein